MPTKQDLIEAKQVVGARLLRAGLREGVVGMVATRLVERAIVRTAANVHAVGIGRKSVDGKTTSQLAVRVYVVQKIADPLIPPSYRVPASIDGIPTDVIESPPAFIMPARARRAPARRRKAAAAPCTDDRQNQQRPVIGGISAGHFKITAGTIAYFCRSTRPGDDPARVFVLSNNHVFANVNQGKPNDDLYQQGPADGGTAAAHFAELARFVEIKLGGTIPNKADAAIGALLASVAHKPEICTIGKVTGVAKAVEDMPVRKHGRTTGYTEGRVTDESYDALIGMSHGDPTIVALFENQMRIERVTPYPEFGNGGDSGSLVVRKDSGAAVGLYFAGPPSGAYGVANHIDDVLRELEVQFV
jgi:hypothetical protein